MNRRAAKSAVDRLIELAADGDRQAAEPERTLETIPARAEPGVEDLEQNPMWKALLPFRMLAPYLSQAMGEMHGEGSPAALEVRRSLGELQAAQQELRLAAQEQSAQMRRLEDELKRTREAAERTALDSSEAVEDVKSLRSLLWATLSVLVLAGVAVIGLLVYVIRMR